MARSTETPYAIETRALCRVFTRVSEGKGRVVRWPGSRRGEGGPVRQQIQALDRVNLTVHTGEVFGLLGPNGAGKTTLIKVLATLLLPTSGEARVLGLDVVTDPVAVRERVGVVSGGEVSGYGILTVRENLWLFSQLHGIPSREARGRIDELLRAFGLWEYRDTRMSRLSTGFRQRLNVARGFVSDPDVLFLDEPTLGLDVEVARTIRAHVREWVSTRPGRTVLLTTHYMLEADELCDRVAVIDRGRIVACDTPAALKRLLATDVMLRLRTTLPPAAGDGERDGAVRRLETILSGQPGVRQVSARLRPSDGSVELFLLLADDAGVGGVLGAIESTGGRVLELHKPEPTLEDVFLKLVGRRLDEGSNGAGES
ncbi:ABC transporter ATP-binding protein [Carboxydochorda subterranea]|uniref:ABC transporter ATP-binding protein n=1 Tax=Carboxydichorda subterranea TaxID=3109565 RepID=A0ABZ1BUI7_9FIRM|nr:ABC transporter ATP-binding protein [Limnochorda sp. L945t]WRP16467.1 ABC transporter ATP-binding protein [Limnochorda sp. L945t]